MIVVQDAYRPAGRYTTSDRPVKKDRPCQSRNVARMCET
jgi:hypothetical protein